MLLTDSTHALLPTPQKSKPFLHSIFPELIVQTETDLLTQPVSLAKGCGLLWPRDRFKK